MLRKFILILIYFITFLKIISSEMLETKEINETFEELNSDPSDMYKKESNGKWMHHYHLIEKALSTYEQCQKDKCSCHYEQIHKDLKPYRNGIKKEIIDSSRERGVLYQIIDHHLFRDKECMFISRCSGIEHFILKIINQLPNMEFIINTRDWPRVLKRSGVLSPVFSFSKTSDYLDITYPAWSFWDGGPAISLYPTGLGRWDMHRKSLVKESKEWPWEIKIPKVFFRGSRTSSDRDSLIYLSREDTTLVDAKYTKNQAWKSEKDTLYAPPASEVSLESHCQYKMLFNYRGVAASFRFKHLFLCSSLVFHVGSDWIEFFYAKLHPWVHYIPVPEKASVEDIRELILFSQENEKVSQQIATRGFEFIRDHLRMKDVYCYWRKLLRSYAKLLLYQVEKRQDLIEIRK